MAAAAAPGGVSGLADRTELPGGLRVLSETVPGVRSVSVGIWIGIGSRDELPEQAGAAHYLEHLLFKGTERRTAAAIAEELDAVGGELNAFTAKEHTCYYAHVLETDLPLAVDVLADVVTAATLRPADVEVERSVVLEEIAIRDDDPEELLGELFDEAIFGVHPLARPVLGSEESVRGLSRETLHGFWRGEYTAPRMVVAGGRQRRARTGWWSWSGPRSPTRRPGPAAPLRCRPGTRTRRCWTGVHAWCCARTTPSRCT